MELIKIIHQQSNIQIVFVPEEESQKEKRFYTQ